MYEITKEDLLGKFPYSKVLQGSYGNEKAYRAFKPKVQSICNKFKKGKESFEACIMLIDIELIKVMEGFPEDFPKDEGWYDKKLRFDGAEVEKKLNRHGLNVEICKVCKVKLEARYREVREIEGIKWVIHKRCMKEKVRYE